MTVRACMLVHEHYPRDFRVRREARALVEAGVEVCVVALRRPGEPAREWIDGAEVIRLPVQRHRGAPLAVYLAEYLAFAAAAAPVLSALHLARRFDLVHVHTPPDFLLAAAAPLRLAGVRLVLDIHDLTPELYASRFHGRGGELARTACHAAEQGACRLADRVITTTGAFRDLLIERGVRPEKVSVVHNCPDPVLFPPRKPATRTGQGGQRPFVIIHHGTILHRYGQDLLLEAFSRVAGRIPRAELHVYGDGDLLPRLRRRAARATLRGRVFLHGEVPQEEVARALAGADLCVVPNRSDPIMELAFPTKLLEAMQVGVASIASSTRLVAETFAEGGVHLVPPGDARQLAGSILHLATDYQARAELVARAREQIGRFCWDQEKQKLVDLYRGIV